MGLGKDDKLGHVRDTDDLPVHLSGEVDRFLDLPTVYEPEPRNQKGIRKKARLDVYWLVYLSSAIDLVVLRQITFLPGRHIGCEGDTVIDKC